jgi:hypothetical protein
MPAFEGLRILRQYGSTRPGVGISELVRLVSAVEADANSLDFEAAVYLHEQVHKDAPYESVGFYRVCIATVILLDVPDWAKLVTLGRGIFIKRLRDEEYRDIRSLFREAKLLEEHPDLEDVKWWDALQTYVRLQRDLEFNERSRDAELRSLEFERAALELAGIEKPPVWMAIDDNTAGYDILSYWPGEYGLRNKLIEVKSTVANPPAFILSRNEWEQAAKFGESFVFQIWVFPGDPEPRLYEKTVREVEPHIPKDVGKGRWKSTSVPLKIPAVT